MKQIKRDVAEVLLICIGMVACKYSDISGNTYVGYVGASMGVYALYAFMKDLLGAQEVLLCITLTNVEKCYMEK